MARTRTFRVELDGNIIKRIPIKGLHHTQLPFDNYLALIKQEAISEWRLYFASRVRYT
ncbi:hypothetical protein KFU94_00470 [Chloroflexi bacterium TSY]|nr:hypothetical protein [Chloroflexi bacterium TSY]